MELTKMNCTYDEINKLFVIYTYLLHKGGATKYIPKKWILEDHQDIFPENEVEHLLEELEQRNKISSWIENGVIDYKINLL